MYPDPDEAYPLDPDEAYGIRSLGQIVRRARHSLGATQRMVGRRIGVSQSVVSRLENGKLKGLSFRKVGRLIALLDGRVEYSIVRTMEPNKRRLPTDPAEAPSGPLAEEGEPAAEEHSDLAVERHADQLPAGATDDRNDPATDRDW